MCRLCMLNLLVVLNVLFCYAASTEDVVTPFDDIACNSTTQPLVITDYNGWFTSPNYPSPYPGPTNCQWLILSQEIGGIVRLDIGSIIAPTYLDRILIYDGNTTGSPFITAFDNTGFWDALATNIRSSGPSMLVVFNAITSNTVSTGFNASFTSLPLQLDSEDPCYPLSRPLPLDGAGTLQSNGFPQSYWNFAECQWIIEAQEPENVVTLNFTFFQTEYIFDAVSLYDGNSSSSALIASFNGTLDPLPAPYRSTGPHMFVRFNSDSSVLDRGFSATYAPRAPSSCGIILSPAPNTTVVGDGFDLVCYLDAVTDAQFASSQCSDTIKSLPGIGDASSLVAQGGQFGCLLSTANDFVGADRACYDNYQWASKLSNCASCTKMIVCIRFS